MNRVGLAVLTVFLVMAKLVIESPPNRKSHESSEELLTTSRMLRTPEIPEVPAISEMRGMPGIGDGLVIAASGINTPIIDGKPWGGRGAPHQIRMKSFTGQFFVTKTTKTLNMMMTTYAADAGGRPTRHRHVFVVEAYLLTMLQAHTADKLKPQATPSPRDVVSCQHDGVSSLLA